MVISPAAQRALLIVYTNRSQAYAHVADFQPCLFFLPRHWRDEIVKKMKAICKLRQSIVERK
ncbi:hypothetical protein CAter282_2389 [Collimonas arenae]|uniref:Uncharacterized protein n=1 Tax=Collimonas arenae TaxID=279058 RepID=A0A127PR94_9BURK|nr:hypothetical protein CAter10_2633 [Collimonas arenae]AMP10135.1 hypothetical protein CAter282_2389 [Collimonas arenae]